MKKNGGLKNLITSFVWIVIIIGVLLAIVQTLKVSSVDNVIDIAKEKAHYYAECIPAGDCGLSAVVDDLEDSGVNIDITDNKNNTNKNNTTVDKETKGYRGPVKGEPYVTKAGTISKNAAVKKLKNLDVIEKENDVKYSRSEWKHWANMDGKSCWNTREEVLNRDAKPETIIYVDKQMNVTDDYDKACAIGKPVEIDGKTRIDTENSGEWVDPYSGRKITSSSDIDIDHIVPLSYAAKHGGQEWDKDLKEQFANDLENLLATSAKENRSKGDKGPSEYMPSYKAYHCQYSKAFIYISDKYSLSITKDDYKSLENTLKSCEY